MQIFRDLTLSRPDALAPYRRTGFGENFAAARRSALLSETQIAGMVAFEEATREREQAIADAYGQPFGEVWDRYQQDVPLFGLPVTGGNTDAAALWWARGQAESDRQRGGGEADSARREEVFARMVADLPAAQRGTIPTLDQTRARAAEISRQAVASAAETGARADGYGVLGQFSGGLVGAMQDPVNAASLFLGLPASSRILTTAIVEGVLSGGTEAAIQPSIQAYRQSIGLDGGVDQALENIAAATVFGGAFGGGMKAGQKLVGRLLRIPDDEARKTLDVLAAQDDRIRGAVQAQEQAAAMASENPGISPELHRARMDQAIAEAAAGNPAGSVPETPRANPGAPSARRIVVAADPAAESLPGYDVSEIGVDAKTFQFKSNGDADGVVDTLRGVTNWDPIRAGAVLFYQYADGRIFVADGHQRVGLARRIKAENPSQNIKLFGHVLREADGVTPEDARLIAAMKNVAQADTREDLLMDAAKVMRIAPENLAQVLPPRSSLVKAARGLANLDERGWGLAVNGVVDPNHAAAVGRLIPDDPSRQMAALTVLAKADAENLTQAEAIIRDIMNTPVERVKELSLFGEEEFAASLYLERAQVLDRAIKQLKKDKAVFSTLGREAGRIEAEGNALNADANVRRAETDAQAIQTIQTLANRKGPLADALNAAARRAKQDGNYGAAVRDFATAVRDAAARGDFEGHSLGPERSPADAAADRTGGSGIGSGDPSSVTHPGGKPRPDSIEAEQADLAARYDTPGGAGQKAQSNALAREIAEQDLAWPGGLKDRVVAFVRQAMDLGDRKSRKQVFLNIGAVDAARAAEIDAVLRAQGMNTNGIDFTGRPFTLAEDEVRKILRDHGGLKEAARGQIALKEEDFAALVEALRYGNIGVPAKAGKSATRMDAVEFSLARADRTFVIVRADIGQLYKRGGPRLRVLSMWKRKAIDGEGGTGPVGANLDVRSTPQPGKPTPDSDPQRTGPVAEDITPKPGEINLRVEETEAGTQILIDGVDPVSVADRLSAQADAPLKGGDAAPPAGGLFDDAARRQIDLEDLARSDAGRQEIPLGETVAEDGSAISVTRSAADLEAEHAADLDFVESLKLCGRGE